MLWKARYRCAQGTLRQLATPALATVFLLAASAPTSVATAAEDEDGPVVVTRDGAVRGFERNGVYEFRGIPYAAAPIGPLRWVPPQPAAKWEAVRDAMQFANICLQVTTLGPFAGPANANEDCLYLNVYSPDLHPRK